ncbi:MAG: LysM peptidoglycan-binding domain-containing protein, partial [Gemmatimonadota bacterium]|nr:LysM peptidoglycan-binding domain-containing protein [Gemmatimonadota bacterium]
PAAPAPAAPVTPAPTRPAAPAVAPPRRTAEPLLGETVSPPPAARPRAARTPTTPPARTPAQPPARTPARTQPAAPARPAAGARTHVVVQGETLFGLARRYGVSVDNLRTVNKLPDDNIRIGQRLVIPAR